MRGAAGAGGACSGAVRRVQAVYDDDDDWCDDHVAADDGAAHYNAFVSELLELDISL